MSDIYDRIDELLKKRGWSRRQLAVAAEIPPSTLQSAFDRKTKNLSSDYVSRIAVVLDVNMDDLVDDELKEQARAYTLLANAFNPKRDNTKDGFYSLVSNSQTAELIEKSRQRAILKFLSDTDTAVSDDDLVKMLLDNFDNLNRFGKFEAVLLLDGMTHNPRYNGHYDEMYAAMIGDDNGET